MLFNLSVELKPYLDLASDSFKIVMWAQHTVSISSLHSLLYFGVIYIVVTSAAIYL